MRGQIWRYGGAIAVTALLAACAQQVQDQSEVRPEYVPRGSVVVSKTANPEFTRTYKWTVDKSVDQAAVEIPQGSHFLAKYEALVSATFEDSAWKVSGKITITNTFTSSVNITSVTDVITPGGIAVTTDCTLPVSLAAGATMECNYSHDFLASPGAGSFTNTASVIYQRLTYAPVTKTATKGFAFTGPTSEVDKCVNFTDSLVPGANQQVCYGDLTGGQKTIKYSYDIIPADCLDYEVYNLASILRLTGSLLGSDSVTIAVDVACEDLGCTLTQGYWKTHADPAQKKYDPTWDLIPPDKASSLFFDTGMSWVAAMWQDSSNYYFALAQQYIAAYLNKLNGASVPAEVQLAMDEAAVLLAEYDNKAFDDVVKAQMVELVNILTSFNEGNYMGGPPHCSERIPAPL